MNSDNKTIKQINKQIDTAWKKNHKVVDKEWEYMDAVEQYRRDQERLEKIMPWVKFLMYAILIAGVLYFGKIILK